MGGRIVFGYYNAPEKGVALQFCPRGKVVFAGVIFVFHEVRATETDIHLVVHGKGVNAVYRPSLRPIAYSIRSPWIVVEMRAKISNRASNIMYAPLITRNGG